MAAGWKGAIELYEQAKNEDVERGNPVILLMMAKVRAMAPTRHEKLGKTTDTRVDLVDCCGTGATVVENGRLYCSLRIALLCTTRYLEEVQGIFNFDFWYEIALLDMFWANSSTTVTNV